MALATTAGGGTHGISATPFAPCVVVCVVGTALAIIHLLQCKTGPDPELRDDPEFDGDPYPLTKFFIGDPKLPLWTKRTFRFPPPLAAVMTATADYITTTTQWLFLAQTQRLPNEPISSPAWLLIKPLDKGGGF